MVPFSPPANWHVVYCVCGMAVEGRCFTLNLIPSQDISEVGGVGDAETDSWLLLKLRNKRNELSAFSK